MGLLFVVGHGLLIAAASRVAERRPLVHGFQQLWYTGPVAAAHGL